MIKRIAFWPLTPLIVLTAALSMVEIAYGFVGSYRSGVADLISSIGWFVLLLCWIDADIRRRGTAPCFDFGMILIAAHPAALAWYCFWSRGWRGLFLLLFLIALAVCPAVIAVGAWGIRVR
jgi:hypothetical protein